MAKPKLKRARKLGASKGEPQRTARVRYLEPPTKPDGNPFFALRVPGELLRAFKKHATSKRTTPTALVRGYMVRVTGVKLDAEGDE